MTLQVIHRDERQPACPRERLCGGQPHEQRPHEPGALGDGHSSDVSELDPAVGECLAHDGLDELEMPA